MTLLPFTQHRFDFKNFCNKYWTTTDFYRVIASSSNCV